MCLGRSWAGMASGGRNLALLKGRRGGGGGREGDGGGGAGGEGGGVGERGRLSHEIAKPVQSADTFFELSYLKNFLYSRYFVHANRKKTP